VGNETADLLEIPHSKWSIISEKGRILGKLIQGPQKISVINHVVNKMGWAMLTHGTHHFAGGKTHFQIPTEIRRAWRLPPLNASARIEALMPDLVEKIRQSSVGMADEHIKGLIAKTAVLMAQADGEVDDLEIAVLKTLFQSMERGHRTEVELNKAIDKARAEISAGGYESYVDALAGWAIQAGCLKEIISLSVAVAYANSGIAEEERQMITALGAAGEMEGDDLATLIDDTRMQIESIELETESNDSVNDQFVTES
jgi:tellurite resistance protein